MRYLWDISNISFVRKSLNLQLMHITSDLQILLAFAFRLCPTSFLLFVLPLCCLFIFIMFFETVFHPLAKVPGKDDTSPSCDLQALLQCWFFLLWVYRGPYPTQSHHLMPHCDVDCQSTIRCNLDPYLFKHSIKFQK